MSAERLGYSLKCDRCGMYLNGNAVESEKQDAPGWATTSAARAGATSNGWQVGVREMLAPRRSGTGSPKYALRDFCSGCASRVVVVENILRTERTDAIEAMAAQLSVTQIGVMVELAMDEGEWMRPRQVSPTADSHRAGALAALVRKGYVLRRKRKAKGGTRVMWLYRLSKAGAKALAGSVPK